MRFPEIFRVMTLNDLSYFFMISHANQRYKSIIDELVREERELEAELEKLHAGTQARTEE